MGQAGTAGSALTGARPALVPVQERVGSPTCRARISSMSMHQPLPQLVCDGLWRSLTAVGLVRRIQPSGSVARYESRVGDNHHHVICRSCGTIADVDCAVGHTPCLTASDDNGFTIDEAEVVYWGLCANCATRTTAPERIPFSRNASRKDPRV